MSGPITDDGAGRRPPAARPATVRLPCAVAACGRGAARGCAQPCITWCACSLFHSDVLHQCRNVPGHLRPEKRINFFGVRRYFFAKLTHRVGTGGPQEGYGGTAEGMCGAKRASGKTERQGTQKGRFRRAAKTPPRVAWWAIQDSNLWPLAPEANALSI